MDQFVDNNNDHNIIFKHILFYDLMQYYILFAVNRRVRVYSKLNINIIIIINVKCKIYS